MTNHSNQSGFHFGMLALVILLVMIVALGLIFMQNLQKAVDNKKAADAAHKQTSGQVSKPN